MNQPNEQEVSNRRVQTAGGEPPRVDEHHQARGDVREDVAPGTMPERRDDSGLTTADLAAGARERATEHGRPGGDAARARDEATGPLFADDTTRKFRSEWDAIQTAFVDDPRSSVQRADRLVADVMQRLAQTFAEERKNLEGQWEGGGDASTEDLRVALQRYRSFFGRLLTL